MSNPYQGYTAAPEPPMPAPRRSRRPSRNTGVYAGVLALSLVVYALGGMVWGLLRPTYTAYVEDAETASIAVEADVAFTGFIWFAISTGIIGAVIALVVFLRSESTRGLPMLIWIGLVSLLGAATFLAFGDTVATLLHGDPSEHAAGVGETFQVVPSIQPGSALFMAPFLAVLMYWCAVFVTPLDAPDDEAPDTGLILVGPVDDR